MSTSPHSCLLTKQQTEIPLESVEIIAKLSGICSDVTVTQRYSNQESVDVEAVYVFPLDDGASVCAFTAKVGDKLIRGIVEEREQAFARYDAAMAAGDGAFLMDQERPNIFTISVGNLKPQQTVEITITYVALLKFEGQAVRLMIPTTVAPRYAPAAPPQFGVPDADRINPPVQDTVPYGLTLQVHIAGLRPKEIASPSHQTKISFTADGANVALASESVAMDRDFVLLVTPEQPYLPEARVACETDGTKHVMVTFHPNFATVPYNGSEILFLLDCSGSMEGESIAQAKRAMALCIRALNESDTFNIICFGSRYTSLWPQAQAYNQANLHSATTYIQNVQANLGGTEMLAPLKQLLNLPIKHQHPRQILLLTDGEVSNEADVIELCKGHAATARIFTFGIGADVSTHLVHGIANASRGAAEFIYPGERIEPKVLRMFARVTTAAYQNIALNWRGLNVEQVPSELPTLFNGDSVTVFGRINGEHGTTNAVQLTADADGWEVPIDFTKVEQGGPIPTLWARHMIRELEEAHGAPTRGSNQKRRQQDQKAMRLLELGKRYGLLSSATSYVAIEERTESDKTQQQSVLRQIPITIAKDVTHFGTPCFLRRSTNPPVLMSACPSSPPVDVFDLDASTSFIAPDAEETSFMSSAEAYDDCCYDMVDSNEMVDPAAEADVYIAYGRYEHAKTSIVEALRNFPNNTALMLKLADVLYVLRDGAALQSLLGEMAALGLPNSDVKGWEKACAMAEELVPGSTQVIAAIPDNELVFELLMTQHANGSFPLSPPLIRWLGEDRLNKFTAATLVENEALVATAVVVMLLQTEAPDHADEWGPAVTKALRWLSTNGKPFDAAALLRH